MALSFFGRVIGSPFPRPPSELLAAVLGADGTAGATFSDGGGKAAAAAAVVGETVAALITGEEGTAAAFSVSLVVVASNISGLTDLSG